VEEAVEEVVVGEEVVESVGFYDRGESRTEGSTRHPPKGGFRPTKGMILAT
jgi:hypothetical protein